MVMNPFDRLTTDHFQDALIQHVDASKPDPLAKSQIEKLRLSWEQHGGHDDGIGITAEDDGGGHPRRLSQRGSGTLTFMSDVICIAVHVHVRCECNSHCKSNDAIVHADTVNQGSSANTNATKADAEDTITIPNNKCFENEFYIRLTVSASFMSVNDHKHKSSSAKEGKIDRKERAMKRKLRTGKIKRLRSDPFVRKLLIDDEDDNCRKTSKTKGNTTCTSKQSTNDDDDIGGLLLCEALIQQNERENTSEGKNSHGELEERVNVHEGALEGIRNAIFSHLEDNLDVLELLLNMPYLPRSSPAPAVAIAYSFLDQSKTISMLAQRAYLRLLEDAMFDACEKEGEDELLDDLNISDTQYESDSGANDAEETGQGGKEEVPSMTKKTKRE